MNMPSNTAITVREATISDLATLVRFNAAMAQETEDKALDMARLEAGVAAALKSPEKGLYLVAEVGGRTVGSLLVTYEWSDWRNGAFWWIQSVYVLPEWRRRGVYSAMYQWVQNAARSQPNVCGIRLYVHKENTVAQGTYANLGMVKADYYIMETDFVL